MSADEWMYLFAAVCFAVTVSGLILVLKIDLPWMNGIQRAKKPSRLPVVFTRSEVKGLLAQLDGTLWLIASLIYGSGMRLMECVRLRVKDLDFHYKQIIISDAQGSERPRHDAA